MQKKIKQLAYGIFDYRERTVSFSTERIELEVTEGKNVSGAFTISSSEGKLRGMVYSTQPRMECLTPRFDGEEIRIHYEFHSEGLLEGAIRKGEFVILCEQGEYHLSFSAAVVKCYAITSIGKIKTLDDFVRLAEADFSEAYSLFYSANFSQLFLPEEKQAYLLYEGIRREAPSMQALEVFLTGIGKKKPVRLALEQDKLEFLDVAVSVKEQLCLRKSNWGYVCAEVTTDAAFLHLEKTLLTSEEFLGSTCFLDYYIDVSALHAGKNFGRILFYFCGQELSCEICVTKACADNELCEQEKPKEEKQLSPHQKKRQGKKALMQLYLKYRFNRIVTGVWATESIQILEALLEEDASNDLYRLMKAQAFLMNRQRQEASWILEDYKRSGKAKDTPEWGYYLYLCTLMERETSYVNRLTAEIEKLFLRYPDNALLFWILLYLREEYQKKKEPRLKALEGFITAGHNSPCFYLEVCQMYEQEPYLLTKLGNFERKILNWARKQGAISKELAVQILHLSSAEIHFEEKIFALLLTCYELADTKEAVTAICSYLIKGQKFSREYHKWYALGVSYDARITNLYEAYLLSAEKEDLEPIPKPVLLYFQYHNTLAYKQLALLYASIIKKKEEQKAVYLKYRRIIEQFAIAQIEAGHMDENLAVIYKELMPLGILNPELAEQFSKVLFIHKLTIVRDAKKLPFVRALIVQEQWKQISCVQITDQVAYFQAYTQDYCILLQDAKGQLYTGTEYYEEHAMLNADLYLKLAGEFAADNVPYFIYTIQESLNKKSFSEKDVSAVALLLASPDVREKWKTTVLAAFMRGLSVNLSGSHAAEFLKSVNVRRMQADDRCFLIEQLVQNHCLEQAYALIQQYGYDGLTGSSRAALCSFAITAVNFEADDYLLGFAADTFALGRYNEVILNFLCSYFSGALKQMIKLWKAAEPFKMDTYELEERILTQMLYTGNASEELEKIYKSYCKKGGKELLCMAYLTYFSHLYLVKNRMPSAQVFLQIEERMQRQKELNDAQKYALLKYYAGKRYLSSVQYEIADILLLECSIRGVGFSFFKQLDARLQAKYQIYDKYYLEYHRKPGIYVRIRYRINDEAYEEEELKEVYDGIYAKELVLFLGDTVVSWILDEEREEEQRITVTEEFFRKNSQKNREKNRYTMLNEMLCDAAAQKTEHLKAQMLAYQKKKSSAETVFELL